MELIEHLNISNGNELMQQSDLINHNRLVNNEYKQQR